MCLFVTKVAFIFFYSGFFQIQSGPYKTLQGQAQGTTYRIVYEDKKGIDFSKSVDSLFYLVDQSMSLWNNASLISKINDNQSYGEVDEHFAKVFGASEVVSKKTKGYFDVTIGPLVKAWGFGKDKDRLVPNMKSLDSLKKLVNYKYIRIENGKVIKKYPESLIDFNAIAQGYTVDLISEFLINNGVLNFLVEVGGEVRANGKNEKLELWKVGIENPKDENNLQAIVSLGNKSLATSGSYRKFFVNEGKKYSHAIDPRLGKPVFHNVLSMTVIANTCTEADAFATAFLVMGLKKAKHFAKKEKIDFFAIFEQNSQINIFATEGMESVILKNN
jgi:thiamine biosynthesis lipoprotein